MNRTFSKPILCNNSGDFSFYLDTIDFSIEVIDNKIHQDTIEFVVRHNLTSKMLLDFLYTEKVKLFCKIKTSFCSKLFVVDYQLPQNSIFYDRNRCQRIDKIELSYYIIASENIQLKYNEELNSKLIDKEFEFTYKKGELLAISNVIQQHYSLQGTPFINIKHAPDQENKGLLFSTGKNVIDIKVGTRLNEAYTKLKRKKEAQHILNAFLAFNSILYALLSMINENVTDYENNEWYKCLEACFADEKYDDLKDFIDSMKDGDKIDINEIYRVCQSIIGNALERNIILTGRII